MKPFSILSDIQVFRAYTAKGDFSAIYSMSGVGSPDMRVEGYVDSFGVARIKPLGSVAVIPSVWYR